MNQQNTARQKKLRHRFMRPAEMAAIQNDYEQGLTWKELCEKYDRCPNEIARDLPEKRRQPERAVLARRSGPPNISMASAAAIADARGRIRDLENACKMALTALRPGTVVFDAVSAALEQTTARAAYANDGKWKRSTRTGICPRCRARRIVWLDVDSMRPVTCDMCWHQADGTELLRHRRPRRRRRRPASAQA